MRFTPAIPHASIEQKLRSLFDSSIQQALEPPLQNPGIVASSREEVFGKETVELKKRGLTKIEFCDLYGLNREIVHVKRYTGSSELSHLFQQGIVSAELFSHESEFRKLVNDKLSETHKMADPEGKLNATQYQVVYGIISKSKSDLSLPFFSKVVLRNAKRRLLELGYEIRIGKIARTDGNVVDEPQE